MSKFEVMDQLLEEGNVYLRTKLSRRSRRRFRRSSDRYPLRLV